MKKGINVILAVLILAGCGFLTGCGDDDSPVDTVKPVVSSMIPNNLATGVDINASLTATFSEKMAPESISTTSFILKQGANVVPAVVTYVGIVAMLNPVDNLAVNTSYIARVTTAVKDLAGNTMFEDKVWSFITGSTTDATAPTVSFTDPAGAAVGVVLNANISATFDEAINPNSVNTASFTLKQGATLIPADVQCVGSVVLLKPSANLAPNTTYTATLSTAVKDLADNALATEYTWSFTTGAAVAAGPAPVNLGTASLFVILAKSGIDTTGTTAITGDIGISPAAATYITGFSLSMDVGNTFSTTTPATLVTGRVFAADYHTPTPANLTTAINNMETAFVDAAGRAIPSATELGAGNISGLTIVPGLYKWGTGVLINSDVTLAGSADDVWIFQIGQGLTMGSGARVTLAGGAVAKNIFWQCSGAVSLNTTAHLEGNVLSYTEITLATGSTVNGRLLSQTAVTLDQATVTMP